MTAAALRQGQTLKPTWRRLIFAAAPGLMWIVALSATGAPQHGAAEYVPGEAIVTFKESVSLGNARKALKGRSLTMARHFARISERSHRHCGLIRSKNKTTLELIAELRRDPSVETAEPNYLRWPYGATPDDPLFPRLWGLENTGQSVNGSSGTAHADIGFLAAWPLARPSAGPAVVAVIDTGVDYTHPDLASNMWVNSAEIPGNGIDDDGNGYADDVYGYDFVDNIADPTDSGDHGTHVAGTVAATGNNQLGVVGVGYQARIMALRTSTDGSTLNSAAEIEAIDYAITMKGRGANVVAINASFGGGGYSVSERAAIQSAGDAGIIFCAAAGNSATDHDTTPDYPSSYRLPNMIVFAASDQNDNLAGFSDYGATTVDLAAPGVNILSTQPLAQSLAARVQMEASTYSANPFEYAGITAGITAPVYNCGLGYPADFPAAVSGNIALIARGTLLFSDKVANAMAAGARAAIIYNNTSGNFLGTLGSAGAWIPAVAISQADGQALIASLPASGTVVNYYDPSQAYQYMSGTSMAAPHGAGAVAFAAMNFPNDSVSARIQRILAGVDAVPGLQGRVITGGRLNLRRIADADGNGLPDWWEQDSLGHPSGTDPAADPDGDGADNRAEWIAGTDPTNATSRLRLTEITPPDTNGVVIRWQSAPGRHYRIERTTNLLSSFAETIRTNIAAVPPSNSETDTTATADSPYFYRIGVE